MLHIKQLSEGLNLFKALGSDLRVQIITLLLENGEMNMNEIASNLKITNGALTSHIKKLEESGLIQIFVETQGHGNQKRCKVKIDKILIDIIPDEVVEEENIYTTEIPVGMFSDYKVYPTCGISESTNLVGEVDNPNCFSYPERINAKILWFSKGYVEYIIPNRLPVLHKIDQITFSMEISSEAPGVNNEWPSDISFLLNDVEIGTWTSLGDFGDVKGIFTPDWWFPNWNQYGLLKMLVINKKGTFIDGLKISDIKIDHFELNYKSTIRFKMMVKENVKNVGGLTIFGKNFGNYNQDINIRVKHSPM